MDEQEDPLDQRPRRDYVLDAEPPEQHVQDTIDVLAHEIPVCDPLSSGTSVREMPDEEQPDHHPLESDLFEELTLQEAVEQQRSLEEKPDEKWSDEKITLLVKQALAGNSEALGEIFLYYKSDILKALRGKIRNQPEVVNDLYQDTYYKAWRYLPELKYPTKIKSWLVQIATHLAVDVLRRQQRSPVVLQADILPGQFDGPDQHISQEEMVLLKEELQEIFADISADEQKIITWHLWDGLKFPEIARLFGGRYSAKTLQTRFYQACHKIRNKRKTRKSDNDETRKED